MNSNAQQSHATNFLKWSQARPIPDSDGFAGSCAGVSNSALIVAGGSNFPGNKRPWENGIKIWYDKIFVLESPEGAWTEAGKLPRPMAYGVALTYKGGVLCLGGGDAKQNHNDVFILSYSSGKIKTTFLPSMPSPLINVCGVIINDVVYIMGHFLCSKQWRKVFLNTNGFRLYLLCHKAHNTFCFYQYHFLFHHR